MPFRVIYSCSSHLSLLFMPFYGEVHYHLVLSCGDWPMDLYVYFFLVKSEELWRAVASSRSVCCVPDCAKFAEVKNLTEVLDEAQRYSQHPR